MSEQNQELEKSIDETVEEMKLKIAEIAKESTVEEDGLKEKLAQIAQRSIEVITSAIEKLKSSAVDVKNSEEFKKSLAFVSLKSKEITDATIDKLKAVKESQQFKDGLSKVSTNLNKGIEITSAKATEGLQFIKDKANAGYKELEKNEKFSQFTNNVKDVKNSGLKAVNDFMNKPEVVEKVEKAKDVTIDLAEKALDALRNWLRPEEKGKEHD